MDVRFVKAQGRVLSFSVNYRAEIGAVWYEVIRYDTHHGHLHVHRFWRGAHRQVEHLEPAEATPGDYTRALHDAESDIKERWRHYRSLFGRPR